MNLLEILKEDSPWSTMRVAILLMIVLFFPAFVGVWTYLCFHTLTMVDIPSGVTWLIGVLLGGKAAQKLFEMLPAMMGKIIKPTEGEKS